MLQFENYTYIVNDGGGGGYVLDNAPAPTAVGTAATPPGYFDAQLVGIPAVVPEAVVESAIKSSSSIVITDQVLVEGFGSYLADILPNDIAVTAGAFGASMQQIRNITQVPFEKFAQVVACVETTQGLDLVNGTNVPVDVPEARKAYNLVALGTGPYQTFTYSDFYGCMSGLPYDWKSLQTGIFDLQTDNLTSIYKQLYLATSWKQATVSVQYSTYTGPGPSFDTYYHVTGITLVDSGGGYGREGASAPTITISNGGSGTTVIGTDDTSMSTFGKVISVALSSAGSDGTSIPTATVDYPPGGSSYPNSAIQGYIDAANTEIALIRTIRPGASMDLNDIYNKFGTQLGNEQRARNRGLSPLPDPYDPATRDPYINKYSIVEYSFVDSLPLYGAQTQPHMAAQTLEAISDLTFVAGQSVIAAMREARNKDRFNFVGISQDNNIPDIIEKQKEWIANTIVDTTVILPDGNVVVQQTLVGNAVPAYPKNVVPLGYYDPVKQVYNAYNVPSTITNVLPLGLPPGTVPPGSIPASTLPPGVLPPGRSATPVDTGGPKVPGSLAKSPYQNLIPPQLSTLFTSDVLLPAQYNIPEAIEHVITCNCDCWI